MLYDSACLGLGTVKSTMATIIGPRELPKPEEATQPSYAPDHSALVDAHFILFLWPSSSLQTQKQFHQESTGSRQTIHPDGQTCLAVLGHCEAPEGKHHGVSQVGGKLEIHAHSSTHSCPTINHPFVGKRPPVLVLVHSKLLESDTAHLLQTQP